MALVVVQPWHPTNFRNQEKLWKAEQKEKERLEKEREKEVELKKSLDLVSQQRLIKAAGGDPTAIRDLESHPLNFMYIKPPGFIRDSMHDGEPGGVWGVADVPSFSAVVSHALSLHCACQNLASSRMTMK